MGTATAISLKAALQWQFIFLQVLFIELLATSVFAIVRCSAYICDMTKKDIA
jgi:hypothetical protein